MSDQYVALPLDQKADPSQSSRSGKIVALVSVLTGFFCVALWAVDHVNQQNAIIDGVVSLAAQPMKQVTQPIKNVMRMQQTQTLNFMRPASRAVFRVQASEMDEAELRRESSRRVALASLLVLPLVDVADQAEADGPPNLKVGKFGPYFNYAGDLAVTGKVSVKGKGTGDATGQDLSWSLSGVDPKCEGGPGGKPNSCGVHIHKGQSCKEDALGHYFATPEDPWKTVVYTSKNTSGAWTAAGSNVKVATQLTQHTLIGRTFIVHDFEGDRVACGILE